MTVAAKVNFGAEFWMAPHGAALVKVAELISISPPVMKRGTIDATTHDSAAGAMEVISEGLYDPGDISGQVNYIAASAGDTAMIAALTGGGLYDFKLVSKSAAGHEDMTFSGIVTSYGPDARPTNGKQTASFAMKVSGPVAQAASA